MDKRLIFSFSFLLYGTYILYFHEFIEPLGFSNYIFMFILLAIIPVLYLCIPLDKNLKKALFEKGMTIAAIFLVISTMTLLLVTSFLIKRIASHSVDIVNYWLIPIISTIAALIMIIVSIHSAKSNYNFKLIMYVLGLYAFQIFYSIFVLGVLYIRV